MIFLTFLMLGSSPLAAAESAVANTGTIQAEASAEQTKVSDVIVTVRRREEKLQDTPIAVSVVNGRVLAQERLDRIADYSAKIANFAALQQNTRVSTLTVRGLGGNANSDGSEAGVGLIVDNVFFTHPGFSWLDFVDLESVELARGPQGTLLGKNTTLGALVVTTRKPSFTPEATFSLTASERDRRQVRANLSGPLIGDRLAGRLTLYRDTGGGYLINQPDGEKYLDNHRWAVRGQLLYRAGDFTDRIIAEAYQTKEYNNVYPPAGDPMTFADGSARNGWQRRLATAFGYSPSYDLRGQTSLDTQKRIPSRTTGLSNQADWALGGYSLSAITAWRRLYFRPRNDSDGTPFAIFGAGYDLDVDQYSQEVRLASPSGGAVEWQAGVYLLKQQVDSSYRTLFYKDASAFLLAPAMPSIVLDGLETDQRGRAKTFSAALFGQGTWRFSARGAITAGLRYTAEDRKASNQALSFGGKPLTGGLSPLTAYRAAVTGPSFMVSGEKDSAAFSWLINPSWKLTDTTLLWASASRGAKSGGANLGARPGDAVIIRPEVSTDVEAGIKSTLWGGRAILNLGVYRNDVEDYQASQISLVGATARSYLSNAAKVRLKGIEIEGQARLTDAWRISFSAAKGSARYVSYKNAPPPIELTYAGASASVDLSGSQIPASAKFTGQVSANYDAPLAANLVLFGYANEAWRSDTFLHPLSAYGRQKAYGLTNAGIGVRTANGRWAAQLWARNLFDKAYVITYVAASATTPYTAILGEPRTVGLTLTAKR